MQLPFSKNYRQFESIYYGHHVSQFDDDIGLKDLLKLYDYDKRNEAIQTDLEICFNGIPFGVPKKKIIAKLGKPNLIKKHKIFNTSYDILVYQKSIHDIYFILHVYLLKDIFFLGMYNFSYLNTSRINFINNILTTKYLKGYENINCSKITIYDAQDNRIHFIIGAQIVLQYIAGNKIIQKIVNQLKKEEEKLQDKTQENIFKQFYDKF